jgi:hypothetical protein
VEMSVFDEHHEVMLFWEKHKKDLPKTVLHVDFHSDMWAPGSPIDYQFSKAPGYLKESIYMGDIRELVQKHICPTSFLLPSILRYRFENIIFLKPLGLDIETKHCRVGTLHGKGKIIRGPVENNEIFFPDLINYTYSEITSLCGVQFKDYILDIDMDFFSCNMNPKRYRDIFIPYPLEVIEEIKNWNRSRDDYNIDLGLIATSNNGAYIGQEPDIVPIYNDSFEWIKYSIDKFVSELSIKPKYLSICRSEKMGYTPTKYVEFIEGYLKSKLSDWSSNPVFPSDVALELSPFVEMKGNTLYNYSNEISMKMDALGYEIIKLIDGKYSTKDISTKISQNYGQDFDAVNKDVINYVLGLKKYYVIK